ncbi:hypothetical protein Dacsa_1474 [Dactylococcopsis salina PCC 8305]|uniref:Uncharacterized protein n=1 Tax=Dactylococcopsis salina (strain PCC 8305) TaxID=13035 RepID=K9YTD1_DACS8|nr:hypothetical protein Dacsa_1474 [Dactylococcopsis salina PCC 8305]
MDSQKTDTLCLHLLTIFVDNASGGFFTFFAEILSDLV